MKVFSVHNIKGGVGKTTVAVNLAYLSGLDGARTLIWDLDPQGGASYYLGIPSKLKGGVKKILHAKQNNRQFLRMTGYPNLDLLPADFSLRKIEQHLLQRKKNTLVLRELIHGLSRDYDRIFLDCPAGISLLVENVIQASDVLLVPVIPTVLSLRSYNRFVQFLTKHRPKRLRVLPFFSIADQQKTMHTTVCQTIPQKHSIFLNNTIPDLSMIESMGLKRAPVPVYAGDHPAANHFHRLWEEVKKRSKGRSSVVR